MTGREDAQGNREIYELGFLVLPSISEEDASRVLDSLRKIIVKAGATEISAEAPLKQKLSYSMSKTIGASKYLVDEAYIGWIKFELEPSRINVVKSEAEKLEEILRLLIIRAPRETHFTFAKARARAEEGQRETEAEINGPKEGVAAVV